MSSKVTGNSRVVLISNPESSFSSFNNALLQFLPKVRYSWIFVSRNHLRVHFLVKIYSICKLQFSSIILHCYNRLSVCVGIPFFQLKIDNRGLRSVYNVNPLPCINLRNFLRAKIIERLSFSIRL